MNADEILLIRDMRRALDKLPLDYNRVEITLSRGHVQLSGTIKTLRSQPNVVLKDELDFFQKKFNRDPRVKSLTVSCRLHTPEKKEHEHFGDNVIAPPPKEEE